jgi:ribosomal protein L11 methyltransferase
VSGWVELSLRVRAGNYERVETLLEGAGALAVTREAGSGELFGEPGEPAGAGWSEATVSALFDAHVDLRAIEAGLAAQLGGGLAIARRAIADAPWHEVWKQGFAPQNHAGGLCVCPTWCEPPPSARHVLRLDPGGAFGTGTHPTTALCLDWVATAPNLGTARVLDYGCGSGILAIACAVLGAPAVTAVDLDPAALDVTRENARANGVADRLHVIPPDALDGQFDVLLANILLAPLLALAPRFAGLVAPGGALVLSGLLEAQTARVLETYAGAFTMAAPVHRGEWSLLAGRRRR